MKGFSTSFKKNQINKNLNVKILWNFFNPYLRIWNQDRKVGI